MEPPAAREPANYGALGPRSPLGRAVSRAARQKANAEELRAGYSTTLPASVARAARKAAAAASRSWAACLRKIFEVYPVLCVKCGGEMTIVAVIMDDAQLDSILASQGWPRVFPMCKEKLVLATRALSIAAACLFWATRSSGAQFGIGDILYRDGLAGWENINPWGNHVGHAGIYIGYSDGDSTARVVEAVPDIESPGGVRKSRWVDFVAESQR